MYFTIQSTNAALWCKMRKKITDTKTEETDKQIGSSYMLKILAVYAGNYFLSNLLTFFTWGQSQIKENRYTQQY